MTFDELSVSEEELKKEITEVNELEKTLKQRKEKLSHMIKLFLGESNKAHIDENIKVYRTPSAEKTKIKDSLLQEEMAKNKDFQTFCLENLDIKIGKPKTALAVLQSSQKIFGLSNEFMEKVFTTTRSKESFNFKVEE